MWAKHLGKKKDKKTLDVFPNMCYYDDGVTFTCYSHKKCCRGRNQLPTLWPRTLLIIYRKERLPVKDLSEYRILNKASLYREFKDKYGYPDMQITSYRRVLYGESTYLGKGRSPYIADMFRFFAEKLEKQFIDVAYDLLDSEFFGRKNTFLDVIVAEKNMSKQSVLDTLGDKAKALDNIRLCDLNEDNRKIYETALLDIKE